MRALLVSAFIVALAGCSPPAANNPETPSAGAAATAAAPAAGPQLRPGRWNKTITAMGQTMTEVECVDTPSLDQLAHDPNSHCTSEHGFQPTAGGLVYDAACTGEDGGGNIHTVMTGDLQNHYVVDSTMTGAGQASQMRVQVHVEGAYEGACRGDE